MNSFNLITKYFFLKLNKIWEKKKWRGREQVGDRIKKEKEKRDCWNKENCCRRVGDSTIIINHTFTHLIFIK